ncbi:TetR/AcrR family transcriptional regulator [Bradyrhizobium guangzhouense]|nr:TetR/AcrR family transcriptional regulator [Bradyrhizobium guangzhouense]
MGWMETNSKRDEILDVAEAMIRNAGFNAFSTRDVASAVGIKASSVHYYFPTKVDMGVAVTERYTERFLTQLGDPGRFKGDVREVVSVYVNSFRETLIRDDKLCLCAVLGAEIGGLPQEVGGHTRTFFDRNIAWLRKALAGSSKMSAAETNAFAVHILAALEGGMILSKSLGKEKIFESVAAMLNRLCDAIGASSDRQA